MLAGHAVRDRLSIQHQVTLSALWLGLNFQSSALLPIVVPAQVLLLIDKGMTVDGLLRRYPEKSARSTVAR